MLATGCGDDSPARVEHTGGSTRDPQALVRAEAACERGNVAHGLASVDSVLAAEETPDALVVRSLCRWVEFHSTRDADLGEAIEADLSRALDVARADGADDAVLARIYSHRAALRRARGTANWPGTLADLNAAIAADTTQPLYLLDRAVARLRHGDSLAAVNDLDRFLQLDTVNTARADFARELREEVQPRRARP